jgi:DNA modification methylase
MKTLEDKSIDCFLCDLPYGALTVRKDITKHSWDKKIDLNEFWIQIKRLARNEHCPVLMFCTTKFGHELISSNSEWFRYDLVWSKENSSAGFLNANIMPLRSHEMIYVFSEKAAHYTRKDIHQEGKKAYKDNRKTSSSTVYGEKKQVPRGNDEGVRCARSVLTINCDKSKGIHPTQKPLELYTFLLERYCPLGGTILDPTAGSFNSCFAAEKLGLQCIGIEMNAEFFQQAQEKIRLASSSEFLMEEDTQ